MRRLRWLFRACELWEIGEWVFVGLLCAGLALFGAGAVAEGPFRGPASERAAHEGHDSLVLVFGTLGGFFGLLAIVGLIAVIRGVRRERDGRWG